MPYLIIALLASGIAVAQAGIGGMSLLYSLPAYGLIGLAALCSLFEPLRRISAGTRTRCLLAGIGLAAYVVVRAYFSPVDYLARHDLFMTLGSLLVYLLAAIFLVESRYRYSLLVVFFVFAIAHFACGVVQFRYGQFMMFSPWIERVDYAWRASGFYLNPNHLAGLLEVLGVMATSLACWSSWRLVGRMIAGYAALLCFIGVALTGSRGGYVSTLAALVVFAVLSMYVVWQLRRVHFWSTLVVVVLLFSAAIGGGVTLMLKSQTLNDRLNQIEETRQSRRLMWKAAVKQFERSPLLGTGSGTYQIFGRQLRTGPVNRDPTHVQNDYLELLADYGVLGAMAMAVFIGIHFWSGAIGVRRILGELSDIGWGLQNHELALLLGAFSGISALLVHSFFDCNLHVPGNTLVAAFLFSILAAPTVETLLFEEGASPSLGVHALRFLAPGIGLYLLVVGTPRVEAEYYAETASRALAADDFETAIRCAESGIAVEKRNPHLFYYLGEATFRQTHAQTDDDEIVLRDSQATLEPLRAGLKLSPDDLRLLLALGRALDAYGRFTEALTVYTRAVVADPTNHAVHAHFGLHFERQNRLSEAIDRYGRAVYLGEPAGGFSAERLRELEPARPPANPDAP